MADLVTKLRQQCGERGDWRIGWGSGGGEGVTRLAAAGGGRGGSVLLLRLHFSTCQWSSQQFITLSDFSRSCVGYIHGESQLICIILTSKREDRLSVRKLITLNQAQEGRKGRSQC